MDRFEERVVDGDRKLFWVGDKREAKLASIFRNGNAEVERMFLHPHEIEHVAEFLRKGPLKHEEE